LDTPIATPDSPKPNLSWPDTSPIVGLTIGVVSTFLMLGAILWGTWTAYQSLEEASSAQLALQRLTTKITRLDDFLAWTAQYAAMTGEPTWEARHREAVTELRAAIAEAAGFSLAESGGIKRKVGTHADRKQVTAIETTAFELVRAHQSQDAVALFSDEVYAAARREDSAGLAFLTHAIDKQLGREVARLEERTTTTHLAALSGMGLLLLLWTALANAIRRSLAAHRQAERESRSLAERIQSAQRLESLNVLAGGIAHDFNNLLTGILSNAGTARRKLPANDSAQQHLNEIVQGSKLAAHLTSQLLAYAGKGQFEIVARDLSAAVSEIQDLLETSVRRKAKLTYDLFDRLPAIQADPSQLHQALMNLVLNAAESIEGEVDVTVRTRVLDLNETDIRELVPGSSLEPCRCVALEVEDFGWGMDRETLDRVFIPFFTTKSGGRGLGLAATLGIAHRHGGGMHVSSELGRGTLFRVLFPASDAIVAHESERPVSDLSGHGVVLVVDDDDYILQAVYAMLESYGYSVRLANTGRQAIEIYTEHCDEIDLVLLDMSMPGMNGEETFRELRGIRSHVRVLLSTGYAPDEAAQRFTDTGLAGFLRKPYDAEELGGAIKRILDRQPNAGPTGRLDQAMMGLRASYERKLPEKLEELAEALRLARGRNTTEATENARVLSHRLAGTSGSYGLALVSAELDRIESSLRALVQDPAGLPDGRADELWTAIDESQLALRELQPD
jgi:signal transduction histidine kinase/CheY-like chemotaxis protein